MAEAETLDVSCPNCQKQFRVKRMLAGTRVRCPDQACRFAIVVPEPKPQLKAEEPQPEPVTPRPMDKVSWLTQPLPSAHGLSASAPKTQTRIKPSPSPPEECRAADFKDVRSRFMIAYVTVMSTQAIAFFPQTETIRTVEWVSIIPRTMVVILLLGIFLNGAWAQIQDGQARTTPGKAVGYRFIPLYNFYWEFVAVKGLAEDIEQYARARNIAAEPIPRSLTLSYCILSMVAPVVAFIVGVCLADDPNLALQIASMVGFLLGIPVAIVLLLLVKKIAAASAAIAEAAALTSDDFPQPLSP